MEDEQRSGLQNNGIEICAGPGEGYFHQGEIDFGGYPSWQAVDFQTLRDVNEEVMSARGCPYHCNFCHNTERRVSFFTASRTADNIELLFRLGTRQIFIVDDIFTLRASHMANLLHEAQRRGIPLEGRNRFFSHVSHLSPEILEQIARYRPTQVQIGIESGDDRMLRLMGKPFTSEEAFGKVQLLARMGVRIGALFLIGFPGENEESLRNTLAFANRIKHCVEFIWVSYYQPVRGTVGYSMVMGRVKTFRQSKRNTEITYVDPDLTEEILAKYRNLMMLPPLFL